MLMQTGGLSQNDRADDTIDLGSLFRTLWRGKFIILFAFVSMILLGGFYAYFVAKPQYKSTAVVMLNNREDQVVDLGNVLGGLGGVGSDGSLINTELEVMRSRSLMEKVVDELDLMSDPEFNITLTDPSRVSTLKGSVKDFLMEQFGLEAADDVVSKVNPDEQATPEQNARQVTINRLLKAISIRNVPQSLVFEVTVEASTPKKAARVADTLVDLYVLNQLEVKFEASQEATIWLTNRVTELKAQLEASEEKVKAFGAETELVSPEALRALEIQLKDLRDRLAGLGNQKRVAIDRLAKLEEAQTPEEQAEASGDTRLTAMLPRLQQPAQADAFEKRFVTLMVREKAELQRVETQLGVITTAEAELQQRVEEQSNDLIELQQLNREAEVNGLLYEYFLTRLRETSAQQGIQQADSRSLSDAIIPVVPSAPRKSLILAASGMLGLLIGIAFVLLREAGKNTYRIAEELEQDLGFTVFGQLPQIPSRRRVDVLQYLADNPASAAAEAVRNTRTSIKLSNIDNEPRVFMVCSSIPGEGKTTVSFMLAKSYASMGKKVLLVEGDIRRNIFGSYISDKPNDGMVSVMLGQSTLDDVIHFDETTGTDILFGGNSKANAADLFASETFANIMSEIRQRYDYVIIDTPPVLVVPDARIIEAHVDATAFVVKWDSTHKEQVAAALRQFEGEERRDVGLVLNQISVRGMKQYGYGGAYGSYGAYSSYGSQYYKG